MPSTADDQPKRNTRKLNASIPVFDLDECLHNPALLKRLDEERKAAHVRVNALENQLKKLKDQLKKTENQLRTKDLAAWKAELELKLVNEKLDHKESETLPKAIIQSVLLLIITLLFGFGVNIATSTTYGWTGWIMIAVASILHLVTFFNTLSLKAGKKD